MRMSHLFTKSSDCRYVRQVFGVPAGESNLNNVNIYK